MVFLQVLMARITVHLVTKGLDRNTGYEALRSSIKSTELDFNLLVPQPHSCF